MDLSFDEFEAVSGVQGETGGCCGDEAPWSAVLPGPGGQRPVQPALYATLEPRRRSRGGAHRRTGVGAVGRSRGHAMTDGAAERMVRDLRLAGSWPVPTSWGNSRDGFVRTVERVGHVRPVVVGGSHLRHPP